MRKYFWLTKVVFCTILVIFGATASAAIVMKLSHNQGTDVPVHKAMQFFAEKVAQYTDGAVKVRIYPNAALGNQRESMELVESGALAMAKTNAAELEAFDPLYSVYNLPYLFRNREHFYKVISGKVGAEILDSRNRGRDFIGITYYDAGSRSFYGGKAFRTPADLQGIKVRVQPSPSAVKMMELLGAHPTPIPFGELYSALQQGVVDAAENNESALVDARHGEVAKYYSRDEHTRVPDVLVMSLQYWDKLTSEQQKAVRKAGYESMMYQKDLWSRRRQENIAKARRLGVSFVDDVDKAAFEKKVLPMQKKAAGSSAELAALIDKIRRLADQ